MIRPSVPAAYLHLLRQNGRFRRLWYGQIVSQLGDWLDSIALYTIVLALTGSSTALGLLLLTEFLPPAIIGPFAGVVLDRLPRKLLMVLADLGRAALVLTLLLVQGPEDLWLIYTVSALKVSLNAFFEPARAAILPDIVAPSDLVTANALSGATWSVVLAFGAALGGLITGVLGAQAAFIADAASYLLSAWLIAGIAISEAHTTRPRTSGSTGISELREGLRYIRHTPDIVWYVLAKALWNLSAGVLLLFTLYGQQIFPLGRDGAITIGLFYAARGVGAAVGPIVVQQVWGTSRTVLRRGIGLGYYLSLVGYLIFSGTSSLPIALLAVVLAHTGGSINWVFSSTLLQLDVPEQLRGRVFAIEYAVLMLVVALSSYGTGVASDAGASPRELALVLALIFALPGTLLSLLLWGRTAPTSRAEA